MFFFNDFHNCTRWKIDVFKDFYVCRYMHSEKRNDRSIVCKETSLTLQYSELVMRTSLGNFVAVKIPKKYPNKHVDNVSYWGPPSLKQQALHHYLLRKMENFCPSMSDVDCEIVEFLLSKEVFDEKLIG